MNPDDPMDDVIDAAIDDVLRALDRPQWKSSIGDTYDLSHLITELGPLLPPLPAENSVVDLLESIIQETSASPTISERQSFESSPVSPKRSFWSRLFAKKSQDGASLPAVDSGNDSSTSEAALKAAEEQVEALEVSGPADLTSLSALSREMNRKICVWSSGMSLRHESGASRSREVLNIQFHSQPEDIMGHWSLLGDSDPQEAESGLNDCLFNAIAAQTGVKPAELREATVARMRTNIRSVARRIRELARREACDRIVLMVGGARYIGQGPKDAARILDNSQKGKSHPTGYPGHPRGHASNPKATEPLESAENYSMNPDAAVYEDADDGFIDSATESARESEASKAGEAGKAPDKAGDNLTVPEGADVGYGSDKSPEMSRSPQMPTYPPRPKSQMVGDDPRRFWKAGFLSIQDQDRLAHLVLSSKPAQEAMERLNSGTGSELVRFKPGSLPEEFPKGANFINGFKGYECPISELVIILKHYLGKKKNKEHDVFVFTFYPRLKKIHKKPRPRREKPAAKEGDQGKSAPKDSVQGTGQAQRGPGSYDQGRGRGSYYPQRSRGSFDQGRGRGSYDPQRGRGSFGSQRSQESYDEGKGRGQFDPSRGRGQFDPSRGRGRYDPQGGRGSFDRGSRGSFEQRGGRGGWRGADRRGYQGQNWQGSRESGTDQRLSADSQEFIPRGHRDSQGGQARQEGYQDQQNWKGSQGFGHDQRLRVDSREFVPQSQQYDQQGRGQGFRGRGYHQ